MRPLMMLFIDLIDISINILMLQPSGKYNILISVNVMWKLNVYVNYLLEYTLTINYIINGLMYSLYNVSYCLLNLVPAFITVNFHAFTLLHL